MVWTSFLLGVLVALNFGVMGCGDDDSGGDTDADTDTDTDTDGDTDNDSDSDVDTDSDSDSDTDGDTDTDTDTDGDTNVTPDECCEHDPINPCGRANDFCLDNGEFCFQQEQCASQFCESYSIVPPDPNGKCTDAGGTYYLMGTLRDMITREPVEGGQIQYASGTQTNLFGCQASMGVDKTVTSGADGRFDDSMDSKPDDPLGYVARASKTGYYITVKGVGDSPYFWAPRSQDIYLLDKETVDQWSDWYEADSNIDISGRLYENGGAVGRVIDVDTGRGVTGIEVRSTQDSSGAKIAYLNENMDGFQLDVTASSGLFIVMNPGLKETFNAWWGDEKVNTTVATIASKNNCIFAVDLHIQTDEVGMWDQCEPCP
ncbi:MAG: hypothetical protein GY847_37260 [Proteobacteria bacterium]|nr:hypothetical protein [Pseudomonadota bacterium]